MISGKTIFISPLDWGMGHATRSASIIRALQKDNKIIIGTTPGTNFFFDTTFPKLQKVTVPAYNVRYNSVLPVWLKLFFDWPRIKRVIKLENQLINELIQTHKIDVVISDSRFGLFSSAAHSIFISHQIFLKTPFANALAQFKNRKYIENFNEVWVPDYESELESLSGALSHGEQFHKNIKYIGPQSAITDLTSVVKAQEKFDVLILLSGAEPQRSILENKFLIKFKNSSKNIVLVRGSKTAKQLLKSNIKVIDFAYDEELKTLIVNSETVICRSGYSTLMDLHLLNKKKLILIPTPGQPEQEYLARYWSKTFKTKLLFQNKIQAFKLDAE